MSTIGRRLMHGDRDAENSAEDMTTLPHLDENAVLYNLSRRYANNEIYTYAGSILIALNPYQPLPHLFNTHMMEQYKGVGSGEISPHVFAVADAAYRAMMAHNQRQSILMSGESGAGKTETTKLIIQYLTYVGGRPNTDGPIVEKQVLESSLLIEAFGNARTSRNDNSSRFCKYIEMQFDGNGRISGAALRTYFLERNRVVNIADGERNYHCFYQLCASGEDANKYKLGLPSNFHYLNQSNTYEMDGIDSGKEYLTTRRAMDLVGICSGDQEAIFRILAAILHLGNIEFSSEKEHDSSTVRDQNSQFHLFEVARLLRCNSNRLLETLCTRSIQTSKGVIVKALDCETAARRRDSLAKTIYAMLFHWLVDNINKAIGQDMDSRRRIGVLDIYGFECFEHNSFEQFCINFANEKLQQHFNEHVFKVELEAYNKEKIDSGCIEFIDNQDILDLIEKKPMSIISLLDEACMLPKSTHETFLTTLFQNFRGHPRLEKAKFSKSDFILAHYCGKIKYRTEAFLEKNRDYVILEHHNLLSSSQCTFLSALFPKLEDKTPSFKSYTVASRLKKQLQALMDTLKTTEPHFIRCVRPTTANSPQKFENQFVLHQLRCGGVLEVVRISLAGYPTRMAYSAFVNRFGVIAMDLIDASYDEKIFTEKILRRLNVKYYQLGENKVFLRAGQIAMLDSRRKEVRDNAAKVIQHIFRGYLVRRSSITVRRASLILQTFCRGYLDRKVYSVLKKNAAAVIIQKYICRWLHLNHFKRVYFASILIQSCIRGFLARSHALFLKKQKAATLIQAHWRMRIWRSSYRKYLYASVTIQCAWRREAAKKELQRLEKAAKDTRALSIAKSKGKEKLEDISFLQGEKLQRVSAETSKPAQFLTLQHLMQLSDGESKNVSHSRRIKLLNEEVSYLRSKLEKMEQTLEDAIIKNTLDSVRGMMEDAKLEPLGAQKSDKAEMLEKLEPVCMEMENISPRENLQSMPQKVSRASKESSRLKNKVLRIIGATQLSSRACLRKPQHVPPSGELLASSSTPSMTPPAFPKRFWRRRGI